MKLILVTIIFLVIAFAMIGIRLLLIKNGQFKGTCASQNPFLKNDANCSLCGRKAGQTECPKPQQVKTQD